MAFIIGLLYVVEVFVCLLLAFAVMLQKPKEGGLGGLGGGMGEAVFGADAGNVLVKATIVLGTVFLINTLALARLTSQRGSASLMSGVSSVAAEVAPEQALPEALPAVPAAPAGEAQ